MQHGPKENVRRATPSVCPGRCDKVQGVNFSLEQVGPSDSHLPAKNEQRSPQRSPQSEAKSSTTRKRKPLDFSCSLLANNRE